MWQPYTYLKGLKLQNPSWPTSNKTLLVLNKLPCGLSCIQTSNMFNLFRKKSEAEKRQAQYQKLMEQAHALSKTDRKAADLKYAEAEALMQKPL